MDSIIEIRNLNKSFGDNKVLNNINLSINKGDIYGILGLSGAGKSTLVRCINGLEKADSGNIIYKGCKVTFDREYRKNVSMIQMVAAAVHLHPDRRGTLPGQQR